jgi:hypothetical protein
MQPDGFDLVRVFFWSFAAAFCVVVWVYVFWLAATA